MKTRLNKSPAVVLLTVCLNCLITTARPQGTAFTYQGRLNDGGNPAGGTYDFQFKLFTDPDGNTEAGSAVLTNGIAVTNGLFTTAVDFGPGVMIGSNLWLQVSVRTNGAVNYSSLSPLQALTPAPYSTFAESAGNLSGSLPATQLSGTLVSTSLAGTYGNAVTFGNVGNSFSGSGAGLTALNASQLTSGTVPEAALDNAWKTGGNAGTTPGTQFIGTSDNQPLELDVAGVRALRLEPDPRLGTGGNNAANFIGGSTNNTIEPPYFGGNVIGGGGYYYGPNVIHSNSSGIFIGAGAANQAGPTLLDSFIGSGYTNTIGPGANDSAIAGGYANNIGSPYASIGGGGFNSIGTNSNSGTVSGGFANQIANNTHDSTISGGSYGSIGTNSFASTIAGGSHNSISNNASVAAIGGGTNNIATAFAAAIGGGADNNASGWASTVAGGNHNIASSNNGSTAVGGGNHNIASGDSSTVAGGNFNIASNSFASVGGGNFNAAGGYAATIPGGDRNIAVGPESFAAGHAAQALTRGAFVWADDQGGTPFASTGDDQFLIRATGGVGINTNAPTGALTVSTDTGELTVRKDGPVPGLIAESSSFSGSLRFRNRLEVWPNDTGTADGYVDIRGNNGTPNITLDGQSGTITCIALNQTSDRNAKENCAPVNPGKVLAKVAALPITEWDYKADAGARHIGPMAQDFHAAFGLNGTDDRHITTVDEGGVALAAIQGLNRKLENRSQKAEARIRKSEVRIQNLEAENAELKRELAELKHLFLLQTAATSGANENQQP